MLRLKKKCSTNLLQAKIFKHECQNITEAYSRLKKSRAIFFSTRNNCCEFPAYYGVIFQSDFQSYFKTPVFCASLSKQSDYDWFIGFWNTLLIYRCVCVCESIDVCVYSNTQLYYQFFFKCVKNSYAAIICKKLKMI